MHRSISRPGSIAAAQLMRGTNTERVQPSEPRFCLEELAGRLVELSGEGACAVLTLAVGLVLDAQAAREPVAWVSSDESSFYPPDLADSGVDLAALVVVRIALASIVRSAQARSISRSAQARSGSISRSAQARSSSLAVAAERLLRSGAFGLLVLDLGKDAVLSQALQSRLLGLAQRHHAALVCLTEKAEETPSLGSLVSLRAQAVRTWLARDRFVCELRVRKDKRRGPTWSEREVYRGPLGLR
jgi:recombination protein RecA